MAARIGAATRLNRAAGNLPTGRTTRTSRIVPEARIVSTVRDGPGTESIDLVGGTAGVDPASAAGPLGQRRQRIRSVRRCRGGHR
ncbi:hypothetical protein, partial [Candidatus Frankia alpina]|uniref:hypothetical protein n=1 Tax=Candidatus Frankia alpina TaxID=2699483 RepID=UPI001A9A0A8D